MTRAATLLLLCTILSCTSSLPSAPEAAGQFDRVTRDVMAAGAGERIIPPTFFGMHVVGLGAHHNWPTVPFGLYRLHDATPRWHALHGASGKWATDDATGGGLARLRYILDRRDELAPGMPALYTMAGGPNGGFPAWLRSARSRADTLAAWQQHVRMLGTQFRGRIRYWEVWNEFDCTCFYRGSMELLVELTRLAQQELQAIDPVNVIIAPAITSQGIDHLAAFLAAGGGRHVDVLAWHPALPARPEADTAVIRRIRNVIAQHGLAHLPLWATESHTPTEAGVDPAAIVMRSYLLLWATGHANFSWYAWDITDYGDKREWVTLTQKGRPDQPTGAAIGYRAAYEWLVGNRLVDLEINGDTWIASLARADGHPAWIVWAAGRNPRPFRVPSSARTLHRIDGSTQLLQAGFDYVPSTTPALILPDGAAPPNTALRRLRPAAAAR